MNALFTAPEFWIISFCIVCCVVLSIMVKFAPVYDENEQPVKKDKKNVVVIGQSEKIKPLTTTLTGSQQHSIKDMYDSLYSEPAQVNPIYIPRKHTVMSYIAQRKKARKR